MFAESQIKPRGWSRFVCERRDREGKKENLLFLLFNFFLIWWCILGRLALGPSLFCGFIELGFTSSLSNRNYVNIFVTISIYFLRNRIFVHYVQHLKNFVTYLWHAYCFREQRKYLSCLYVYMKQVFIFRFSHYHNH